MKTKASELRRIEAVRSLEQVERSLGRMTTKAKRPVMMVCDCGKGCSATMPHPKSVLCNKRSYLCGGTCRPVKTKKKAVKKTNPRRTYPLLNWDGKPLAPGEYYHR